ncbi:MAG: NAD(P)-binding domain-containing protein [Lewinellaceae bacterium]|nr:NAD(P)-binding domain-containing protein [Lewinellaceae bacterium]
MATPNTIVIAGAGRIATHLGKRLRAKGLRIVQVLNRSAGPAQALAAELQADWSDDWSAVRRDADWVLLAVRDDAIAPVGKVLAPFVPETLVTHTSGATPGAVLAPFFERYGVFYPLQSFSVERTPVWSKVPFCVDARAPADVILLKKIAKTIGNLVYQVNDEQRAVLHVAGCLPTTSPTTVLLSPKKYWRKKTCLSI